MSQSLAQSGRIGPFDKTLIRNMAGNSVVGRNIAGTGDGGAIACTSFSFTALGKATAASWLDYLTVPTGGAAGLVLLKDSATDFDWSWGKPEAVNVTYSNTTSSLTATEVQSAIDELAASLTSTGTTFTSLSDTPSGYSGNANRLVQVNGSANALVFTALSTLEASPTTKVGTGTVVGSATTFMRSDAAPPINQAMTPTWTNQHVFSKQATNVLSAGISLQSTLPMLAFKNTGGGTNEKYWFVAPNTSAITFGVYPDSGTGVSAFLTATRSGTTILTTQVYGNSFKFEGNEVLTTASSNIITAGQLHTTASPRLFGRFTSGAGAGQEVNLGSSLTMSGSTLTLVTSSVEVQNAGSTVGTIAVTGSGSAVFSGVKVYRGSTISSVDATTEYVIPFDSEDFDTDGYHEGVTNPTRLTVPSGVSYVELVGNIYVSDYSTNRDAFLYFKKNGSTDRIGYTKVNSQSHTYVVANVSSGPLAVTPGDYFELAIHLEVDTSVTIGVEYTFFTMKEIG